MPFSHWAASPQTKPSAAATSDSASQSFFCPDAFQAVVDALCDVGVVAAIAQATGHVVEIDNQFVRRRVRQGGAALRLAVAG